MAKSNFKNKEKYFLITVDVEDWFQVENFKPWIPFETWDQRELRVERNVHRLLDLFDSVKVSTNPASPKPSAKQPTTNTIQPNQHSQPNQPSNNSESYLYDNQQPTTNNPHAPAPNKQQQKYPQNPVYPVRKNKNRIKATFFMLGWLADRLPNLIREIQDRGHEIASHGCNHELPNLLSAEDLKLDLTDSKKRLEDITGSPVFGYRAPSFAINNDILKIIEDTGYIYDSSYNSFSLHGRYGKISLNGAGNKGIAHKISDNFYELPISNLRLAGQTLPWGGGAYFRLIPLPFLNLGIKSILQKEDAYIFYLHPWELDPDQPRVNQASLGFKFRHYTNLNKTKTRFKRLIENSRQCRFVTCIEYLNMTTAAGKS